MLRTWRLMKEWHNKTGKIIRMETGYIIYPEEYNKFETVEEKRDFFRKKGQRTEIILSSPIFDFLKYLIILINK